jgi:hypothetical protein
MMQGIKFVIPITPSNFYRSGYGLVVVNQIHKQDDWIHEIAKNYW